MFSSVEEMLKFVKDEKIEMIDFKVMDLIGRWHHVTISATRFNEQTFVEGIGIDASNYPGFKKVASADMKIIPDNSTAILTPSVSLKRLV